MPQVIGSIEDNARNFDVFNVFIDFDKLFIKRG